MLDMLGLGGDEENSSHEDRLWQDFVRFSTLAMLKMMLQKSDNSEVMSLIDCWRERAEKGFQDEIDQFQKMKDEEKLATMLFSGFMPDIEELKKKHDKAISRIVTVVENVLIKEDG
jgi:hypothetical protein